MSVTISGTNGIDKVQDGTIQSADFAAGVPSASDLPAGTVLQVVSGSLRGVDISTSSGTPVSTGVYATITPTYANSKIVVIAGSNITFSGSAASCYAAIYRGTSGAGSGFSIAGANYLYTGTSNTYVPTNIQYVDAPGAIATYTYTVMHYSSVAGYSVGWMYGLGTANYASIVLMEIAQ